MRVTAGVTEHNTRRAIPAGTRYAQGEASMLDHRAPACRRPREHAEQEARARALAAFVTAHGREPVWDMVTGNVIHVTVQVIYELLEYPQ